MIELEVVAGLVLSNEAVVAAVVEASVVAVVDAAAEFVQLASVLV